MHKFKYYFFAMFALILVSSCGRSALRISKGEHSETKSFDLNIYVENSGSMFGYMNEESHLRDMLYDYVSEQSIIAQKTNLFFVNDKVFPFKSSLDNFLTLSSFRENREGSGGTNIPEIVEMILGGMKKNEVSILVSDFILAIPAHSSKDYMTLEQTKIKTAIKKYRTKNSRFAVSVYRFVAPFNGYYYSSMGEQKINTIRPYYMLVMGDADVLAKMRAQFKDNDFKHGLQNSVSFAPETELNACFFRNGKETTKVNLKERHKGGAVEEIGVDLNQTLQPLNLSSDIKNWTISARNVDIADIVPLSSNDSYTHILNIDINKKAKSPLIVLSLKKQMPSWIERVNDNEGTNVLANNLKTFGIKYIINGIADAFSDVKNNGQITLKYKK